MFVGVPGCLYCHTCEDSAHYFAAIRCFLTPSCFLSNIFRETLFIYFVKIRIHDYIFVIIRPKCRELAVKRSKQIVGVQLSEWVIMELQEVNTTSCLPSREVFGFTIIWALGWRINSVKILQELQTSSTISQGWNRESFLINLKLKHIKKELGLVHRF